MSAGAPVAEDWGRWWETRQRWIHGNGRQCIVAMHGRAAADATRPRPHWLRRCLRPLGMDRLPTAR